MALVCTTVGYVVEGFWSPSLACLMSSGTLGSTGCCQWFFELSFDENNIFLCPFGGFCKHDLHLAYISQAGGVCWLSSPTQFFGLGEVISPSYHISFLGNAGLLPSLYLPFW